MTKRLVTSDEFFDLSDHGSKPDDLSEVNDEVEHIADYSLLSPSRSSSELISDNPTSRSTPNLSRLSHFPPIECLMEKHLWNSSGKLTVW